MNYGVNHAVRQLEFRRIGIFGKALMHELLDDTRPGKSDQGARLGQNNVAERGETGGDAAGGRIRQQRDVRALRPPPDAPARRDVLAICISENSPSCMRAPPEALIMSSGMRRSCASSMARVIFSPAD